MNIRRYYVFQYFVVLRWCVSTEGEQLKCADFKTNVESKKSIDVNNVIPNFSCVVGKDM
jgi:hypothetical protein